MTLIDPTTQGLLDLTAAAPRLAARHDSGPELLRLVGRVVPFHAARISAFDPMARGYRTVASAGFSVTELTDLDRQPVGQHRAAPAGGGACHLTWETTGEPGRDDAVTVCLHLPDDRYIGTLHLRAGPDGWPHAERPRLAGVLARVGSLVAGLADPMRLPSQLTADAPPAAVAGVVLPDATVVALPGRPRGPHLSDRSPLARAVARALRDRDLPERFRWRDCGGHWHLVRARVVEHGVVITATGEDLPNGLTPREMDVLTLIAGGFSNPQIAAMLVVSGKTVAKHVEHVLDKLECSSRAAAAGRAVRLGLIELASAHEPAAPTAPGCSAD